MLLPVLSTVCLCAGAVVLALGIAALPLFGGVRVYRRLRRSNESTAAASGAGQVGGATGGHRRTGRSNANANDIRTGAGPHEGDQLPTNAHLAMAAAAAAASNEDVWNRTVQMYSARLRNRGGEANVRTLGRFGMNNLNNNNDNAAVDQLTNLPTTPRGFHFSGWFDSSSMLNSPVYNDPFFTPMRALDERDLFSPDGFHDLSDSSDDEAGVEEGENRDSYLYWRDNFVNRTSAMKMYNSSIRANDRANGCVLKFTEQDLNEIIDENYPMKFSKEFVHNYHRNCHYHMDLTKGSKSKAPKKIKNQTKVKSSKLDAVQIESQSSGDSKEEVATKTFSHESSVPITESTTTTTTE